MRICEGGSLKINYLTLEFDPTHSVAGLKRSGRRCRDRMVVGLTTTYAISAYQYHQ